MKPFVSATLIHSAMAPVKPNLSSTTLLISGMKCASCVAKVEGALLSVPGVETASVNLVTGLASVSSENATEDSLIQAVKEKGFTASVSKSDAFGQSNAKDDGLLGSYLIRLVISSVILLFFLVWMLFLMHQGTNEKLISVVQFFLVLPVQFYCAAPFLRSAFNALRHKTTNMDTLVSLGTLTAFFYSTADLFGLVNGGIYFETIVFIVTFILLGKFLEERAKGNTSEALAKLVKLQAKEATVRVGTDWVKRSIHEVKVGDLVKIYPGEMVPVDGIVESGESHVDESMVSGEPFSVRKKRGDKVFGSTMNHQGELSVTVTEVGENSLLSKIIKTVANAQSVKASAQKLADYISSFFVPAIVVLGFLTFLVWLFLLYSGFSVPEEGNTPFSQALLNGISVWVIACPCALGLATPTVVMVITGKGASEGILIKNIQALERSGEIDTFLFDKTGTLTEGKPKVESYSSFGRTLSEEILYLAASAEQGSNHPIALAISQKAKEEGVTCYTVDDFLNMPGIGISCAFGNKTLMVVKPSRAKLSPQDLRIVQNKEAAGKTVVVVLMDEEPLGYLVIADPIKENARQVIAALQEAGKEIALVTGDNELTANHIAKELGIGKVFARVMPNEKSDVVRKIKEEGKRVAMTGDGVNDAPALAVADVSFAMSSGSDIAIESADITLLRNDLSLIPKAVNLSKLAYRKMLQNLFWAFFYNAAAIPLAMGGYLSPEIAAAAMAFSSVSVVTNSLLLKRAAI